MNIVENKSRVAVVAVGGNSLIKNHNQTSIADQYAAALETSEHIARMIEGGWNVLMSHGNGPQVGFMQRRSELSEHELHRIPLDYSVAHTQGSIGYMFQQALDNTFRRRSISRLPVTIVTRILVDRDDPAFQHPTKPIGSFMTEEKARRHREEEGWDVVEETGRGWRRVVPSPKPKAIIEQSAVQTLVQAGCIVINCGGGGVPVVRNEDGTLEGVEAVIDKDLATSLLAAAIGADLFLISTAVDKVALNFGTPQQRWLDKLTLDEARAFLEEGHFGEGSMAPKIRAVIHFLEQGGQRAIITSPENIERALKRKSGTHIVNV